MINLVADSSALQHKDLGEYLQASRNHCIVLSDWTLTEMQKKKALDSSREALRLVSLFPNQCYALKRTDTILDYEIRSSDDAASLIDYQGTIDLRALAQRVRAVPVPAELVVIMIQRESEASALMARLFNEVEGWEEQMVEAIKVFDDAEVALMRKGKPLPDETMGKVWNLLLQTTGDFMVRNQQKGGAAPMKVAQAMNMFGFRYSLCVLIYTITWVHKGGKKGRSVKKRVNDAIDLQVAAVGSFFNGVLSGDVKLQEISRSARTLLRGWGAYVGDDWSPVSMT